VIKKYRQNKKKILSGDASLPKFSDLNIPVANNATGEGKISSSNSKLFCSNDNYYIIPSSLKNIVFKMEGINKDKSVKTIVDRVLGKQYRMGFSQLVKDGKWWYLHMSYTFIPTAQQLDKSIICGVDLGFVQPFYCGLNSGYSREQSVVTKEDILRYRTQIKSKRRNMSKQRNFVKTGHGKKRALKALDRYSSKESNWVKTANHKMSKQIIDFCVKNNAGTIHMEALTSDVKKNAFLSAYWSYYQLQTMVEYKAQEIGIEVKYVNPAYTSQRCSKCGHVSSDNRKTQDKFECVSCGYGSEHYVNADYNASVNIAQSTDFVKSKEEVA
jgi:IS605 OrfB family transposase